MLVNGSYYNEFHFTDQYDFYLWYAPTVDWFIFSDTYLYAAARTLLLARPLLSNHGAETKPNNAVISE